MGDRRKVLYLIKHLTFLITLYYTKIWLSSTKMMGKCAPAFTLWANCYLKNNVDGGQKTLENQDILYASYHIKIVQIIKLK